MLTWFRQLKYRNAILAQVMIIHLCPHDGFTKHLKRYHPWAFDMIRNGFVEGQKTDELSVVISAMLLVKLVESLEDDRRNLIFAELVTWVEASGAIDNFSIRNDLENATDALASRLKWGISYVDKLHQQAKIEECYRDLFYGEVLGSLMGKSDKERAAERRSRIFRRA